MIYAFRRRSFGAFALGLSTVTLAACGGGTATSNLPSVAKPPSTSPAAPQLARATIALHIDATKTRSAWRKRAFTAPTTLGLLVKSFQGGSSVVAATTAVDLSPTSSVCTTSAGSTDRTCTFAIAAPAGTDDFTFTGYDAVPTNGAFASTANALGTATVRGVSVAAGTTTTISTVLGGIVAKLSIVPPSIVDGTTIGIVGVGVNALDADGNVILTDTYATPVTLALTEPGTTNGGHSVLEVNGGTRSTSVTVTAPSDQTFLIYDGKGLAADVYHAVLTATSGNASGTGTFAPLLYEQVAGTKGTLTVGQAPTLAFDDTFEDTMVRYARFGAKSITLAPACQGAAGQTISTTPFATGNATTPYVERISSGKFATYIGPNAPRSKCSLAFSVDGANADFQPTIAVSTPEHIYVATSGANSTATNSAGGITGYDFDTLAPLGQFIPFPLGAYGVVERNFNKGELGGYAYDSTTGNARVDFFAHGAGTSATPSTTPTHSYTAGSASAPFAVVASYLANDGADTIYLNARNGSIDVFYSGSVGTAPDFVFRPGLTNATAMTAGRRVAISSDAGVTAYVSPVGSSTTTFSSIAYPQPANPQIRSLAFDPIASNANGDVTLVASGSDIRDYDASGTFKFAITLPSVNGTVETVSALAMDPSGYVFAAGFVKGVGGAPDAPGHLYRFDLSGTAQTLVSTATTAGIAYQIAI